MSSIIQTSADLYSVSVTHWAAIQSLSSALVSTSAAHWALVSSISLSVQTLSQNVDTLSTDVNNLLALASGVSSVSSAIAAVSSSLNALSTSVANTSSAHWNAISSISNNLQTASAQQYAAISTVSQQIAFASLSIAALSGSVNTTSIAQWGAISSLSDATVATSVAQWATLLSLSASLNTTSVQQWAAIQSVLPSVTGQSGKFLQATPTGTQWVSLGSGGGGGGGGTGYTTVSTTLSVYNAVATTGDVVVIVQTPGVMNLSVVLPSSLSDGQTLVVKKGPDTLLSSVLRVTAAGGTLIDGVSTPASVNAGLGFVAVTYSDKISAYVTTGQKWTDGGGIDPSIPFTFNIRSSPMAGNVGGAVTGYYGSLSGTLGVTFSGISAASFSVQNASTIIVSTAPSAIPGPGDITIYDSIGVSRTLSNYFEYLPYSGGISNVASQCDQVAVANNGTIYYFNNNAFSRVTAKGLGTTFSLGTYSSHGPPTCERISGQVVLIPIAFAGANYRYSLDSGATMLSSAGMTGATRFAVSPNGAYVLGAKNSGGFWYGTNIFTGNITFAQSPNFSTLTVQDICINNAGEAIGIVPGLSVFRSTDGGATWTQPVGAPANDFAACAIGANYAYVCGRNMGVYRSSDSGATWTAVTGLAGYTFSSIVCSANGQYVVACSNLQAIYISYNYGVTFRARTIPNSFVFNSIGMASDAGYVIIATSGTPVAIDL